MAIAVSLETFAEQVSYLYFWDLFGAAIGSLLSLLLINWLGAPGGVLVCALLMLVAACFFCYPGFKGAHLCSGPDEPSVRLHNIPMLKIR